MVELDHQFTTDKGIDHSWSTVLDLEKLVPVVEQTGPESVKAEIKVKMGAMSMKFKGTVEVVEADESEHRALLRVKSREQGGQGHATADVAFTLNPDGGTIHTAAQITGKAASMGEGMVSTVLDALIRDFTEK